MYSGCLLKTDYKSRKQENLGTLFLTQLHTAKVSAGLQRERVDESTLRDNRENLVTG